MWLIWGALLCAAVLFMPSWRGGRAAYQGGWGGSILFLIVAIAVGLLMWRGAR